MSPCPESSNVTLNLFQGLIILKREMLKQVQQDNPTLLCPPEEVALSQM
jgi:hypothetical protein